MDKLYNSEENIHNDEISPDNIFIQIWKSPRRVFNFINNYKYEKHVILLLILAGIGQSLDRASFNNKGEESSLSTIILIAVVVGILFGWITYYIYAVLISWTGKWLNGVANSQAILRMLAYALFPSIIGMIFIIPQILIHGNDIFKSDSDISSSGAVENSIYYLSLITQSVLAIWSGILFVIGLSEIQRFSIAKAILNLLLPIIVLFAAIMVLASIHRAFL